VCCAVFLSLSIFCVLQSLLLVPFLCVQIFVLLGYGCKPHLFGLLEGGEGNDIQNFGTEVISLVSNIAATPNFSVIFLFRRGGKKQVEESTAEVTIR
jgi:hypothetical protein